MAHARRTPLAIAPEPPHGYSPHAVYCTHLTDRELNAARLLRASPPPSRLAHAVRRNELGIRSKPLVVPYVTRRYDPPVPPATRNVWQSWHTWMTRRWVVENDYPPRHGLAMRPWHVQRSTWQELFTDLVRTYRMNHLSITPAEATKAEVAMAYMLYECGLPHEAIPWVLFVNPYVDSLQYVDPQVWADDWWIERHHFMYPNTPNAPRPRSIVRYPGGAYDLPHQRWYPPPYNEYDWPPELRDGWLPNDRSTDSNQARDTGPTVARRFPGARRRLQSRRRRPNMATDSV